jgi:hypothetical protein
VKQTIGYALVSQVFSTYRHGCDKPGCGTYGPYHGVCEYPKAPACHGACIPHAHRLEEHPECQEYQRAMAKWNADHFSERPTGGTRVGPLHYFRDCRTLTTRGNARRKDSRIVEFDDEAVEALQLPICKECVAKMNALAEVA